MTNTKYNKPKITINKVYTKTGDKGKTYLVGGIKVSKSHPRVCAYGEIDELNVIVGGCIDAIKELKNIEKVNKLNRILKTIQNELFNVGNMLATPEEFNLKTMPQISIENIRKLEHEIDFYNKELDVLKSFVLPGGSQSNIWLHLARTVSRKCERQVVELASDEIINEIIIKYLNRLSDFFFVLSRWVNKELNQNEAIWDPNIK